MGISYGWLMNKHSRRHANPNKIGKDPEIESDTLSFVEENAAARKGAFAWLTRRQGYLLFPLLLLEGAQPARQVDHQSERAYAGERSLN